MGAIKVLQLHCDVIHGFFVVCFGVFFLCVIYLFLGGQGCFTPEIKYQGHIDFLLSVS